MARQLGAAVLVAALQAARCGALGERPAHGQLLQRHRRTPDAFQRDDPCWIFAEMPRGRDLPDLRAPCSITGVNAAIGRYNVTLPVAPTEVELLEVPAVMLQQVDRKEYVAALKSFDSNATLATFAARIVSADHAKRLWLAEERRQGLPMVKDKEWRDEFNARQASVWEEASRNFLDKVRQDELAAQSEAATKSSQHEQERAARLQQANDLEAGQRQRQRWLGRRKQSNVAVSLKMAQQVDDLEHEEEADREAEVRRKVLHKGSYRVRVGPLPVTKSARPESATVADLDTGAVVDVFLVSQGKDSSRVRGMIEEPLGWITLYHKYSRIFYVEDASQ